MSEDKGYISVLIADDVDYGERGGVTPGGVQRYVEELGGIWVDGPIPADATYPAGSIVFSNQKDLNQAGITNAVQGGAFDGVMVAAKNVVPKEIGRDEKDKPIYEDIKEDGSNFVTYAVRIGAGTNNVELVPTISNTPGRNSLPTAEGAFSLLNEVVAPQMHHEQHAEVMSDTADSENLEPHYTGQMDNKRYAVIAAPGNIGSNIIPRIQSALGPEGSIIGQSRSMTAEDAHNMDIEYTNDSLEACKDADALIIQTPLTPHTKGMITAEHFAALKDGATYMNSSRPGLEDIVALEAAIRSGKIAGFAADFDNYPGKDDSPMKPYREMLERIFADKDTLSEAGVNIDERKFILKHHTLADTKGPAREDGAKQAVRQVFSFFKDGVEVNPVPLGDGKSETPDHIGPVKIANLQSVVTNAKDAVRSAAEAILELLNRDDLNPDQLRELMTNANTITHTLPTGRAVER